MKRSKHSLSNYKLLSCDMGQLVPVSCFEVLPGDSIQHAASALIRVSPLLAPVMHPVQVRIHHWFVPNRLLWDGWEDFITGGPDGEGTEEALPFFGPGAVFAEGSLGDYLGIPTGVTFGADQVCAMPHRAYNLIFNEYYRDQDLVTVVPPDTNTVQNIAWEKDYFTTARPWPQKGPEVTLPLGTSAPVVSDGSIPTFSSTGGGTTSKRGLHMANASAPVNWGDPFGAGVLAPTVTQQAFFGDQTGLEVDLTNATAVDVNSVRLAFALQRYQEARAQYGSRYTEYLRFLGVRSSDARLQRPEYLGGGKQTISFSEVLQTTPTTDGDDTEGVGNIKGHGIAAMRSRRYRRFFEEHGYVLSLMSIRPKTMYVTGLHRGFTRRTKEDYWQKELEQIGQQEVFNRELYAADSLPEDVFGWQDRYAEYRHMPSTVAGEFRSTLNYWHMARIFASDVALNASFVTADPTKRIHAVQTEDVLWCMVNNNVQARRMVSKGTGIGRII